MPRGVYVRKQEETGYKDRAYWAWKLKKQAGFVCEVCGRRQPARLLRAESFSEKLTLRGRVVCLECLAAEHFEEPVLSILAFRELAWRSGIPLSKLLLRRWVQAELIVKSYLGFFPKSLLTKVALLFHNRFLPYEKLADLLSKQQVRTVILQNLVTGRPEILTIIEEFPGTSMDGRLYLCQRLLSGDILIRSKKKGVEDGRLVQA